MTEKAKPKGQQAKVKCAVLTFAFLFLPFAFLAGCVVDERRGLSPEAQATIDRVTEDIAAGRAERLYEEAAQEWRDTVSLEENRAILDKIRTRLGAIQDRSFHSGREQQNASGKLSGHTLEVVYQTTFERGVAVERFTLLERDGRWLLAGYNVSSEALK